MTRTHDTNGRLGRVLAGILALGLVLGAMPIALAASSDTTASTSNETPAVSAVSFYTTDPAAGAASGACPTTSPAPVTSFNPVADADRTVYACADASDANGYNDICDDTEANVDRSFTLTTPDGMTTLATGSLACASTSGENAALTGSTAMAYWRAPTGVDPYGLSVTVTDVEGASASASAGFDYTALTAIQVTQAGFDFGVIAPGGTSSLTGNTYNVGNQDFTVYMKGAGSFTGQSRGQTIAVGNLQHSPDATTWTSLTTTAASTSVSAPTETDGTKTSRDVSLRFNMPTGSSQWIPKDTYTGTVTFTAQ